MPERAQVVDWASDFDHLHPRWADDPYSIWRGLRDTCPVAHTNRFAGVYFPLRYEDIRAVAYDTKHFSSRRVVIREGRPDSVLPPITSDPPLHRDHRKILLPSFTPEAVAALEPRTRSICSDTLHRLSGRTECDIAVDYAQEIPTRVIAFMLGLPEQQGDTFRRWIHEITLGFADPEIGRRVGSEMNAFFAEHVANRRDTPRADMVGQLIETRLNGQPLSDEHILGTLRLLLVAGINTTWSMIGASLWHLAIHEDDRERLVAEPQLIPTAIEEFLRAYSPAVVGRVIDKETAIGGCPVKAGEMVMLAYGAADRDPAVFADPDQVIIDRAENRHAAFGLGIHRCIGANLARMEIRVAIEEWLRTFPDFTLTPGAVVKWSPGSVRGPLQIPVTMRL
ncbi:cytochrome P450 [Bradyrhizobium sp. Ai1a-2]|uniref:cytochrome P450 n=1 Tax=Bradyrhizobium sp. Ai1a-2 TaxID=196490 RepID=UPI000421207B|nr:cytochrome P450 [Bradyrhizobium sp. Ai1a-2]